MKKEKGRIRKEERKAGRVGGQLIRKLGLGKNISCAC